MDGLKLRRELLDALSYDKDAFAKRNFSYRGAKVIPTSTQLNELKSIANGLSFEESNENCDKNTYYKLNPLEIDDLAIHHCFTRVFILQCSLYEIRICSVDRNEYFKDRILFLFNDVILICNLKEK